MTRLGKPAVPASVCAHENGEKKAAEAKKSKENVRFTEFPFFEK
jgi:hypothetical protein